MDRSTISKKSRRLLAIKQQLEKVKPLYEEADRLIAQLSSTGLPHLIHHTTGERFRPKLINNFDGKNVAWKAAPVRLYDVEFEPVAETPKVTVKRWRDGVAVGEIAGKLFKAQADKKRNKWRVHGEELTRSDIIRVAKHLHQAA